MVKERRYLTRKVNYKDYVYLFFLGGGGGGGGGGGRVSDYCGSGTTMFPELDLCSYILCFFPFI